MSIKSIKPMKKNKLARHLMTSVLALFVLIACLLVFFNHSIAWFAVNKTVDADGMQVVIKGKEFDLITLSNDPANENGINYSPYQEAISRDDGSSCEIWLVDEDSNINNYSATGNNNNLTMGIEPGNSGVIKFYIKPYENVTLDFTFETIGYVSETETNDGQQIVNMTELTNDEGEPACFLNGHVLLFEDKNSTTNYYSEPILTDNEGNRILSREFIVGGDYDADTNDDAIMDAYEVDIYWVWPETLDTLVFNNNPQAHLICDKNEVPKQGEEYNDYTKIVNHIIDYPQYYLKGLNPGIEYTESKIRGRNVMYNDADQAIGMNIEFMLLRLSAEVVSSN